ncbi:hypothetical protein [Natronospira bacteriovora]|uniref:Uncharacterized protein n=1 Tax=Natronospira bacteriovora TaxID=3069753 RepID=A0ABU0W7N8_9GAMM|nr:hypothetical protein [Natronospira sp. AB-CW4]MDQ2070042.1 hypothetical protein [Natronospira sp. AB-CW4]
MKLKIVSIIGLFLYALSVSASASQNQSVEQFEKYYSAILKAKSQDPKSYLIVPDVPESVDPDDLPECDDELSQLLSVAVINGQATRDGLSFVYEIDVVSGVLNVDISGVEYQFPAREFMEDAGLRARLQDQLVLESSAVPVPCLNPWGLLVCGTVGGSYCLWRTHQCRANALKVCYHGFNCGIRSEWCGICGEGGYECHKCVEVMPDLERP